MPDAHGNIKGIALSVSEEKWARIFGRPKLVRVEFDEVEIDDHPNRDNNSDPQ